MDPVKEAVITGGNAALQGNERAGADHRRPRIGPGRGAGEGAAFKLIIFSLLRLDGEGDCRGGEGGLRHPQVVVGITRICPSFALGEITGTVTIEVPFVRHLSDRDTMERLPEVIVAVTISVRDREGG